MRQPVLLLSVLIAFWGCTPLIRTAPFAAAEKATKPVPENTAFLVLKKGEPRPAGTVELGLLKLSDEGVTLNCTYQKAVQRAQEATRLAGGNALEIFAHRLPRHKAACHQLEAVMLYSPTLAQPDLETIKLQRQQQYDSLATLNPGLEINLEPQFPGGEAAIMSYLNAGIELPQKGPNRELSGKVVAQLTIDVCGEVCGVTVQEGFSPEVNSEFIRLFDTMPRWTPAFRNGEPVFTAYTLPFFFACLGCP